MAPKWLKFIRFYEVFYIPFPVARNGYKVRDWNTLYGEMGFIADAHLTWSRVSSICEFFLVIHSESGHEANLQKHMKMKSFIFNIANEKDNIHKWMMKI